MFLLSFDLLFALLYQMEKIRKLSEVCPPKLLTFYFLTVAQVDLCSEPGRFPVI